MHILRRIVWLSALIAALLTACTRQTDNHDHPHLVTGKELFDYHCSGCHGKDGTGMLADQTPANILTYRGRDGIIEYMTRPVNPQRKMPVFATMPPAEAARIASYLLQLKKAYDKKPFNEKKPEELMIQP
jgi:mono/diheme cytochrome c family protein